MFFNIFLFCLNYTARNVSKYGVFSGPYFPVLGLNTEIFLSLSRPYSRMCIRIYLFV